jgi:hypothetical protein
MPLVRVVIYRFYGLDAVPAQVSVFVLSLLALLVQKYKY